MLKSFIPTNKIGSNMEHVFQSMGIKPAKTVHWSKQRRVSKEIQNSREIEKFKESVRAIKEDSLARVWGHARRGIGAVKKVLLVRKSAGKFRPVGVGARNRGFKTLQAVREFAQSIGRTHVKQGAILTPVVG